MNWQRLVDALVRWLELAAAYLAGAAVQKAAQERDKLEGERDSALLQRDLSGLDKPELLDRLRKQRERLSHRAGGSK